MPPSEIIFPRAKERFAGEINGEGRGEEGRRGRGRSRCGLEIGSRGTHDLVYPRNHVRGNENKSVVTGQPCVIFSRRPPSSSSSSSPSLRRPSFHSRKFYTTVLAVWMIRGGGGGGGLEGNTMASGRIYSCHWKRGG